MAIYFTICSHGKSARERAEVDLGRASDTDEQEMKKFV